MSYPGLPHIHLHISCACSAIVGSRLTCFSCSCVRFWTTCCCAVPEFPAACFAFVQCGGHLSVCASRLQSLPVVVPSRRHKQRACLRPELSCPNELLLASRWHLNPNYNRFLWYYYDIFVAVLKEMKPVSSKICHYNRKFLMWIDWTCCMHNQTADLYYTTVI